MRKTKPTASAALSAKGLRFAILISRFNEAVTRRMYDAARAALLARGAKPADIHAEWVPGAWELPFAAQQLARSMQYDALIALGCVIRGETTHHEHVGGQASAGLMRVSLKENLPIGFGLLTTITPEQAAARSGGEHGNKGEDAALAAIEMARLRVMDEVPF